MRMTITTEISKAPTLPDPKEQPKQEKIPGCGALFSNLKALNTKIQGNNSLISELKETLKSILSVENLPKKQLYDQIDNLKEQIDIKIEERNYLNETQKELVKQKDILRDELNKEKNGGDEASIKLELKKLEAHIIMHKLTKKEETEIVDKQTALKKQLKGFGNLKHKETELAKLMHEISETKQAADKKHEEIVEMRAVITSFYGELKSLNPQKSRKLLEIENKIKEAETKNKDVLKQKSELRKEISLKQKEFEGKKEFYLKKQAVKDDISLKHEALKSLMENKRKLNNEFAGNKLLKAKTLLSELRKIDFNSPISMNLNLFEMFNDFQLDFKIKEKNIEKMEAVVSELENSIDKRKEELINEIQEISKKIIAAEKEIKEKQKELKEIETENSPPS